MLLLRHRLSELGYNLLSGRLPPLLDVHLSANPVLFFASFWLPPPSIGARTAIMEDANMNWLDLLPKVLGQVWTTLLHNWPFLVASIFVAAGMKLYLDRDAVARFLRRYEKGGVLGATAVAVTTPLCSCGTTALVLGMMAGSIPWAPIVAFMVASPLTSPEELFYSAGLFGWPFAIAFFRGFHPPRSHGPRHP